MQADRHLMDQPDALPGTRNEVQALRERLADLESELQSPRRAGLATPASPDYLLTVIEHTSDAIFVKDLAGRYLFVNSRVANIMGRPADAILGRTDADLFPPETAARLMADDQRIMAGESAEHLEATIPVDGTPRTFLSTKSAWRDPDGRVVGLLGISRDITERTRAERALRESEERLAGILESAMDAIVTLDERRTITLFNAAAESVFRCTAAAALGRPFDDFASDGFRRVIARYLDAFARGIVKPRYVWAPEGLTARRSDGEEFPIEATLSHAEIGGRKLYTLILRDVNERQRAADDLRKLQLEIVYLREEAASAGQLGEIVSVSAAMAKVHQSIEHVAATNATVLITGETGTGKELVAQAIHHAGPRKDAILVKVNCAALPSGLIESELFGHEKGAFTGALARKLGRFELADGGTLFLDEIGDLPLELQAKLLRVLQDGAFERIGGNTTLKVDVRVVAATNQDLEQAVREQRFRPDLYYRLNVFPIRIPPLRERPDDIPPLVRHFVLACSAKFGKSIRLIPPPVMRALQAYAWPGNVRELQNVIERAVIVSSGTQLELIEWPPRTPGSNGDASNLTLADVERQHILKVLECTGWRVSGAKGAAQVLGLKPTTLESRMKRLGITRQR